MRAGILLRLHLMGCHTTLRRFLLCSPLLCGMMSRAEEPMKPTPKPAQSFQLESYGYRPASNSMTMRAGYTNATVNFIDADHLLLTYSAHKLMPRDPSQREGDDDHIIRGVVIHLPDGKAVRETEWRVHDRAPYLWPLAGGHFLIRIRNNLYSLDPMGKFNPEHLGQRLLVESNNDLELIQTSPARDLLLVEAVPAAKIGDDPDEKRDHNVTATFFQITTNSDGAVLLASRGKVSASDAFSFPFTSMGVLQSVQEDRTHWGFDFHPYTGKSMELAGFTSTCRPRSFFISDAEFFAFGCRGGDDRRLMGGFNLMAEAKWVFTTDYSPLWMVIDAAPAVGRFAMRNTITSMPIPEGDVEFGNGVTGQEVRVFGDSEGDELLRVTVSPIQRPVGNFALSPDGLRLAVFHDTQLEIYSLPPVNAADRKLHEREVQALAPLHRATESDIAVSLSSGGDVGRSAPSLNH
jgi:hypothetical protein